MLKPNSKLMLNLTSWHPRITAKQMDAIVAQWLREIPYLLVEKFCQLVYLWTIWHSRLFGLIDMAMQQKHFSAEIN